MGRQIRVAILDDHQSILDGYIFRLSKDPEISVVGTLSYGEALEPLLEQQGVDVLLLDVQVPTSPENSNPYPILYQIPRLLQTYPRLEILVISMHSQRTLIHALMESGASGYILKDDQASIRDLAAIIHSVASGGIYLSDQAYRQVMKSQGGGIDLPLSSRQMEALSLCAAYPDENTAELARRMGIVNSTMRNLLSLAYLKLNVRNRTAAIAKARLLGLIAP